MDAVDVIFGRRIRQNHALEHATVTILSREKPDLTCGARSTRSGFVIYADLDPNWVAHACDEALARLCAGEAELAIHPNCGTNLAVGTSLAMMGSFLALSAMRPRIRLASALASSLAGIVVARPLGEVVQRHVTTLPDVRDVRVVRVRQKRVLGSNVVEVLTVSDSGPWSRVDIVE